MTNDLSDFFSQSDIDQIQQAGLLPEDIYKQIEIFKQGIAPIKINKPCTIGNGIDVIGEEHVEYYLNLHEQASRLGRLMKFVPASGAASRMFKDWYKYLDQKAFDSPHDAAVFSENISRFPFYRDLTDVIAKKVNDTINNMIRNRRYMEILKYILNEDGLDYGRLPKALLKFHVYDDGTIRTPIDEHLVEAALHTKNVSNICLLHFTVSDIHKEQISAHIASVKTDLEKKLGVQYEVDFSIQSPTTNTIAVDMQNRPFRDTSGRLTFRPGGHGSLMLNLQATNGDIVFIKNIDNVAPDRFKTKTIFYKKIMCGYLIALQNEIFQWLGTLSLNDLKEKDLSSIIHFCREKLNIVLPDHFMSYSVMDQREYLFKKLNRPIRVCGMVKNEGEPGGGPFWVDEPDGTQSLQIVEEFQIDRTSDDQLNRWKSSTHFNPVDIVCGLRTYQGDSFHLAQFVNMKAMSIAHKTEKGRDLKALEWPGLWNGSMSFWNTVFLEMPVETFNPVKTIDDLLRNVHQT